MAQCECVAKCPFFNDKMKDSEGLGAIYKRKYCLGDPAQCARFRVFKALGREAVPPDLYPNMRDRAEKLLAGSKA